MDTIYRLPPYILGPPVFGAAELGDIVDWGHKIHGVTDLWDTRMGSGILVGVLDTGRPTHTDVAGAVEFSVNFSKSYTDEDVHGHATHVCGTLAARKNGRGVVGVAPKAKLCTVKSLGDDAVGSVGAIVDGVHYCREVKCDIISMSVGGKHHPKLEAAINEALQDGIIVVCASGNNGRSEKTHVLYPASHPQTIAIASYNKKGELSAFSARGKEVTVAFPGENILSCWLDDGYRRMSGTSMACPFAAGLMALLLEQRPNVTPAEMLHDLKKAASDRGDAGYDPAWGWGVVNTSKFFASEEEDNTPEVVDPVREIDLFGVMKAKYPVKHDGDTGLFVYLPTR